MENGKYRKYGLKQIKFKGGALKAVEEYPFMIIAILKEFGLTKEEDQEVILKHIVKLVKQKPKNDHDDKVESANDIWS